MGKQRDVLPIVEKFYSLQGEGFHSGLAAFFIRLAGCDVHCPFCDVKEAWSDHFPLLPVEELVAEIVSNKAKHVIVTGGEPCMHNLDLLGHNLHSLHLDSYLETSGTHSLSGSWNWICLSPKKNTQVKEEFYLKANEIKVVVETPEDFAFAEQHAKKVNINCLLYLQPEWEQRQKIEPLIVAYIMQHPQWKISLQIHKYLNIR